MVHVALAGCSGGFGLTLLHHFIQCKQHKVTLLSRDEKPELESLGINVRPVDYFNHTDLCGVLDGVDTVVSCITPKNAIPDSSKDPQIALIRAAKASGVRRFAPSEFAHGSYDGIDLYAFKARAWQELANSGMEFTRFSCGMFMNLLASGTTKVDETQALAGVRPWSFVINMKAATADLPGDGSAPVTWTEINDVCRFVVASLDLERWPVDSMMAGDTASYNEVIAYAEKARGGERYLTKTNSIAEMEKLAEVPALRFYNQARIAAARGSFAMKPVLNELLPSIRTMKITEALEKWWGGVPVVNPSWQVDKIFAIQE